VWLTAGTISGAGTVSANGGGGELRLGGGAGGGRVAIYYSTNQFSGSVAAHGGFGATNGGAGTIYWQGPANTAPQVVVDNGGVLGASNTVVSVRSGIYNLTITGRAVAAQSSGTVLANLLIGSNSWLTPPANIDRGVLFVLTVTNNATIQAGGGILFDGQGYLGGTGTGPGRTTTTIPFGTVGGGGGYGGYGGASISNSALGGISYGSASAPISGGSGGGSGTGNQLYNTGGAGGGPFELIVSNALVLNGSISANGSAGIGQGSGGGAGGSIWLTVGSISGSGGVSANGGAGDLPYGGGGGGGRIAVYYATNQFTGAFAARGGAGTNYGGAGTIYLQKLAAKGNASQILLTIDNGGRTGTNTPLPVLSTYDLTITGGAQAVMGSLTTSVVLGKLLITSNSWLICTNSIQNSLSITNNATIQAGGGILLDGYGSPGGTGTGAGRSTTGPNGVLAGSGAGYGGSGGSSLFGAAGGIAYGSI
jgi:hypothetical protein